MGVFLLLLLMCAHVLLNLWLTTSIDAVAHDAAVDVATAATGDRSANGGAEQRALHRAREALGGYAREVELSFEGSDDERVVLHVTAPGIRLLPGPMADALGVGGIDRRITVVREPAR